MIFRPLQDDKLIIKEVNLKIVEKKLMIVATNFLTCYIFSKIYLY